MGPDVTYLTVSSLLCFLKMLTGVTCRQLCKGQVCDPTVGPTLPRRLPVLVGLLPDPVFSMKDIFLPCRIGE